MPLVCLDSRENSGSPSVVHNPYGLVRCYLDSLPSHFLRCSLWYLSVNILVIHTDVPNIHTNQSNICLSELQHLPHPPELCFHQSAAFPAHK